MTGRARGLSAFASVALFVATCIGLASCGGGGGASRPASGGGDQMTITPRPPSQTAPDLSVGSPAMSDTRPETGATLTLSVAVSNDGDRASAATTIRFYRSTDATITRSDTAVGTAAVGGLAASGASIQAITLTAPFDRGTHYYGACVDAVAGEADTADNCSVSVRIDVGMPTDPGNAPPTGTLRVSGTPRQGEVLTVDTSGISDPDGPATLTFTYSWLADDVLIAGATGASLELTQAQVRQRIRAQASYTDDGGTDETVTSAASAAIADVQFPPTGRPVLSGMPAVTATLTMDASDVDDPDGGVASLSYYWWRVPPGAVRGNRYACRFGNCTRIAGATGTTYAPTTADIGFYLAGIVTVTDGQGDIGDLGSRAVGPVSHADNQGPTGTVQISGTARVGEVLTADTSGISDLNGPAALTFTYTWFVDRPPYNAPVRAPISGATASTYTLAEADAGRRIGVAVRYTDALGTPELLVSDSVGPVAASVGSTMRTRRPEN